MGYEWYDLTWNGMVNPLLLFIAVALIGILWGVRVVSNRAALSLVYATTLGWVLHFDNLLFVVGMDTLPPLDGWAPWFVRFAVYVVGCAFIFWGAWGWIVFKLGKDTIAMTRGLTYLRERSRGEKPA